MTTKDKAIEWLIKESEFDYCKKCVYKKDEIYCTQMKKNGIEGCRKGIVKWFEQENEYGKTLGERIRLKRLEKYITQRELAEKIGVTAVTISKYEIGEINPSVLTLMCIADILGVSTDCLLGRE